MRMIWGIVAALAVAGNAAADGEIQFVDSAALKQPRVWACELVSEGSVTSATNPDYNSTTAYRHTLLVATAPGLQPAGRLGVFIERGEGRGDGKKGGGFRWALTPPESVITYENGGNDRQSSRVVSVPGGPKLIFAGEMRVDERGRGVALYPLAYADRIIPLFVMWPELPPGKVSVGATYSITRRVELFSVPRKDLVLQVRVARVEAGVARLEWRALLPLSAAELEEKMDELRIDLTSASATISLQGWARVRLADSEWLDGGLDGTLHITQKGTVLSRSVLKIAVTLGVRAEPKLTPLTERVLEHGLGSD